MADDKRVNFTESAEFKAAVASAVETLIPTLLQRLADTPPAGAQGEPDDPAWAKHLAYEIATYRGQDNGRFYVEPAELKKRQAAAEAIQELLIELRAKAQQFARERPEESNPYMPSYRLTQKTQLLVGDEFGRAIPVLFEPLYRDEVTRVQRQTEIDHLGIPNLAMLPINEPAQRLMGLFRTMIGEEQPTDPRTGAPIPGDGDLGEIALTRQGNVVRGAAAAAMLRNMRRPEDGYTNLRRGDGPGMRRVQVLGSLTPPIEMGLSMPIVGR